MPVDLLTNAQLGFITGTASPYLGGGVFAESYRYNPAAGTPLANGALVSLQPSAGTLIPPQVVPTASAADPMILGIVVGGPYQPGQIAQVVTKGFAYANVSGSPVAGNFVIGSATSGVAAPGAAVLGETIGVVIAAPGSGPNAPAGLTPIWVNRM